MIKLAGAILFRIFCELGLVMLATGAVFLVVAYRFGRRLWTPEPDKLDRMSSELAKFLAIGLVAARRASLADGDEPELEEPDFLGEVDWRELVI